MKIKGFLFALLSVSSCSLHAGWVATNKYTLNGTDEPLYIASDIERHFISLRNFLVGMNFAFPDKIVLTYLRGRIDSVRWENDEKCEVPNPEAIETHVLTQVDFDSYWSNEPGYITHGFMHEWMNAPCDIRYKAEIQRKISFNNKIQTITVQKK